MDGEMGRGKKRVWRLEGLKPEKGDPKKGEPKRLPVAWQPLPSKDSLVVRRCGSRKQPTAGDLPPGNKTNKVLPPSNA